MNTFELNNKTYNIKDLSILKNMKKVYLKLKPYPHIIIENCLDKEIYNHLDKTYPSDNLIFNNDNQNNTIMKSNTRYQINSNQALTLNEIDNVWKLFIKYHCSSDFYQEIINAFGKELIENFDNIQNKIKEKNKTMNELTIGIRNKDSSDILLDCQVGINSKCENISTVKGPHIDNLNEIYGGLLYFKNKNDKGLGGNLEIYDTIKPYNTLKEFKKNNTLLKKKKIEEHNRTYSRTREFDKNTIKKINEVLYNKNTLVIFLNEINSIHGVSARAPNNLSRRIVNIIGESYSKKNNNRIN